MINSCVDYGNTFTALLECIGSLQELFLGQPNIMTIDINPVAIVGAELCIFDAKMHLGLPSEL
jgi:hypothetical protein